MELSGEDLSCYLHNIWSGGLWKCMYDNQLANKAYFSDITVKNIFQSFTHKMAAKANWHWNYVTVTLLYTPRVFCCCCTLWNQSRSGSSRYRCGELFIVHAGKTERDNGGAHVWVCHQRLATSHLTRQVHTLYVRRPTIFTRATLC